MTGQRPNPYRPNAKAHAVYRQLFLLYRQLHDGFGTTDGSGGMHNVMKRLLEIRAAARS